MQSKRRRDRFVALGLGIALALLAVWGYLSIKRGRPLVGFLRSSQGIAELYPQRAKFLEEYERSMVGKKMPHLPRFPVPRDTIRHLFPLDTPEHVFDEHTYFNHEPNIDFDIDWEQHPAHHWKMRTNSLGMREDSEPLGSRPDVRVLVAGDSHSEGVCNNSESFTNVLETELIKAHPGRSIEALNAAKGSFSFYSYLGTLEKYMYLEPDVFVVGVYGPNDFEEVLTPYHYFKGTVRPSGAAEYWPAVEKALKLCPTWLAQDGLSLKYFQRNPGETEVALAAAQESALDIQELCAAHGIRLIYVYIPGKFDTEGFTNMYVPTKANLDRLYATLELGPEDRQVHNRLADRLLAFLAQHGIETIDARKLFAANTGPFFWMADHHIDVAAHRLIGEALAPLVEKLASDRLR